MSSLLHLIAVEPPIRHTVIFSYCEMSSSFFLLLRQRVDRGLTRTILHHYLGLTSSQLFRCMLHRGIDSNYLVWDNYSSESYTKSHASSRYHQPRHDHEHHRRSLAKRQRQQKCDTSAYIRAYKNPSTMSPETGYTVGPSLRPSIQPPAQCVPPHISLQREKYLSDKQHGRRARHYGFGAAIGGTRSLKVPFSRPLASSASNLFSFATSPITTHEAGHTGQYNTIKRHSSQDEESDSSSLLMSENLVYDMISHRQQQYPLLRRSLHSPVSSLQTMASPFSVSSFTYPSGSVTQRPSTSAAATRSLALASSAPPSSLSPLDTKRSDEAMMMKGLKKLGLVARHNKYPPRATRDAKNGTPSMKPREGAIGADRSNANNTIIHTGSASDADAGTRAGRVRHSRDKDDAMYDNTNPSPRCVNNLQLYMNNLPVSIANTNTNMTAQAYTPSYEISSDGTRSLHALQPSANSEAHPNMNMRLSRKMNIHKKTNDDRFAASLATELGLAGFVQGGRSFVASVKQRRAEEREKVHRHTYMHAYIRAYILLFEGFSCRRMHTHLQTYACIMHYVHM